MAKFLFSQLIIDHILMYKACLLYILIIYLYTFIYIYVYLKQSKSVHNFFNYPIMLGKARNISLQIKL